MKTFWISNEQLQLCLDVGEPNEHLKRFYSKCTVNENCTDNSTQQLAEVTKREATSLDCARAASDGDTGSGAESSFKSLKKTMNPILTRLEQIEGTLPNPKQFAIIKYPTKDIKWLCEQVRALLVINQRSEEKLAIAVEALEHVLSDTPVCEGCVHSEVSLTDHYCFVLSQALARIKGGGD